jgi:hypothetical protein
MGTANLPADQGVALMSRYRSIAGIDYREPTPETVVTVPPARPARGQP